jgi:hypothetical protein
MNNTKYKCPCGQSDGHDDYMLNSHIGMSVNNPDEVVVVETYKCDICGKTYKIVKHYKFGYAEMVYED